MPATSLATRSASPAAIAYSTAVSSWPLRSYHSAARRASSPARWGSSRSSSPRRSSRNSGWNRYQRLRRSRGDQQQVGPRERLQQVGGPATVGGGRRGRARTGRAKPTTRPPTRAGRRPEQGPDHPGKPGPPAAPPRGAAIGRAPWRCSPAGGPDRCRQLRWYGRIPSSIETERPRPAPSTVAGSARPVLSWVMPSSPSRGPWTKDQGRRGAGRHPNGMNQHKIIRVG